MKVKKSKTQNMIIARAIPAGWKLRDSDVHWRLEVFLQAGNKNNPKLNSKTVSTKINGKSI